MGLLTLTSLVFLFFSKSKVFLLVGMLLVILLKVSVFYSLFLSVWLSLLLMLVYVSGLLMLYFYFCSLLKNFDGPSFSFLFLGFFFFFLELDVVGQGLFSENKVHIYSFFTQGLFNFLMIILLFGLWIISKIFSNVFVGFRYYA